jgi:hypothetical protein
MRSAALPRRRVTIGEKKHTLSSLRKLLADSPPREVTVRRKDSASEGLYNNMNAVLIHEPARGVPLLAECL